MIWKVADFCGVHVITYAIMPNHLHVLLRVPKLVPTADEEILRRYKLLHPRTTPHQTARIEVIAEWLKNNTAEGRAWREQQLALMGNLSAFMRLLKQRFSIWFNKTHNFYGTLWAERFKSVLVENIDETLRVVAAYIDLNAVRKGLVSDPKDYRFCGYGEAVAGLRLARRGIQLICSRQSWTQTQARYRTLLYAIGATPRENKYQFDDLAFRQVMASDGSLSLPELLRCRWRYFTESSVLGSEGFVHQQRTRLDPARANHSPPPSTPWGGWSMLRRTHLAFRT